MNRISPIILPFIGLLVTCVLDHTSGQNNHSFTNPILAGFYPDPSICRVGSDYYLVTSSFSYFPGIPIFHSKDLANWKQIGHIMDRPEQLDLDGLGVSRGIFAPAIRYNNGVYYVTCTLVDKGGNFVVTSKRAEGPWSNPVWIPQINGIDPSMFFDDNGKAYIIYNSVAPDDKPRYEGHRTLRMYQFDVANLKVMGDEILLVNGGVDLAKKPIWIEAPHIFQKDGFYYLIAAEGGTADRHSEVVFRSKNAAGPYAPYERNPILTQRHLDPKRKYAITSTGHADFVETESGDWWAVFLGCRPYPPYEENYYNTGRETFLAPVKWQNGWPVINSDHEVVQYHYPLPLKPAQASGAVPHSENFQFRDEFDAEALNYNWVFLRTPRAKWYDLQTRKGILTMQLRPEVCSGNLNPSFLGHRQQHSQGSASVAIDFSPKAENEKAGLLIFQNEKHFYFLCKSLDRNVATIQLYKSGDQHMEQLAAQALTNEQRERTLHLRIAARGDTYSFSFAVDPTQWLLLRENVDGRFLSTRVAGGFVGCVYALYATSLGEPSENNAHFDWFEYSGNALIAQSDSLESNVYRWRGLQVEKSEARDRRQILKGSTTDLEYLEIHATTVAPKKSPHASHIHNDTEELIIVKEGQLKVMVTGESQVLGPGSIALAMPGEQHGLEDAGDTPVTYYVFRYRSKLPVNIERGKNAGGSFMVNWNEVAMRETPTGGRRQHFDRATSMFDRFEMHVSTLNAGLTNHKTHTHRAEEFVLIIKGEVEMQIGDSFQQASAGDVIFLASGIPHALRNIGSEQTEYFAFQWQ